MIRVKDARHVWLVLLVSLLGLFVSAGLAQSGKLVLGEEHILKLVYSLPDYFRLSFLAVTMLGSVWILAIVLSVLFIKERYDIAIRLISASFAAYLITGLAKEFVGRPRPGILNQTLQREILVFGYGFPSAHVALATSIALILAVYLPRSKTWIVPVWIVLVVISRLYLGVHAPLDIVGGFCIGVIAATCVLLVLPPHKLSSFNRVAKKH